MKIFHQSGIAAVAVCLLVGCAGTSNVYETYGDKMKAQGDAGQAMAAYQAQLDKDSEDKNIRAKWESATVDWIREQATKGPSSPQERFAHINALLELAKARNVSDQVADALVGPMDDAVAELWGSDNPEASTAGYWRAVKGAYGWVANLPETSKLKQKYEALRKKAASFHGEQATKNAGDALLAYFHSSLSAWYGGPEVPAKVQDAFFMKSRGNYILALEAKPGCEATVNALRGKIKAMPKLFPEQTGFDLKFDVSLGCTNVKKTWQDLKPITWIEKVVVDTKRVESCSTERKQAEIKYVDTMTKTGLSGLQKKVVDTETCSTSYKDITVEVEREGFRLVTHEMVGVQVKGTAHIKAGTDQLDIPMNTRGTVENIRWEDPTGTGEKKGDPTLIEAAMMHDLWQQLWNGRYMMQLNLAAAAVLRAQAAGSTEAATGEHLLAGLIPRAFGDLGFEYFSTQFGMDDRDLMAVFMEGARPAPKTPESIEYKLVLPKLNQSVIDEVEQADAESGDDGY